MDLLRSYFRLFGWTRTARIAKDLLKFAILTLLFLVLLETFLHGERSRRGGEIVTKSIKNSNRETIKESIKDIDKESRTRAIKEVHKTKQKTNWPGKSYFIGDQVIYSEHQEINKPNIPNLEKEQSLDEKQKPSRTIMNNDFSQRSSPREQAMNTYSKSQVSPLPHGGSQVKWQHVKPRVRKRKPSLGQIAAPLGVNRDTHGHPSRRRVKPARRKNNFHEIPVDRAAKPTPGEPWPYPQVIKRNISSTYVIDMENTHFSTKAPTCDIIENAIVRHKEILQDLHRKVAKTERAELAGSGWRLLREIEIFIDKCDKYPSLESDESYILYTTVNNTLVLKATEVWGALMGLETVSQLVTSARGHLILRETFIRDFPRFKHRGIMLDTARHYLTKGVILKNLDAMAMNKLNVFHWHLIDDQSFPYQSNVFPELSAKGAFSADLVYTHEDIKDIVEYARMRGIRVIPEIDTPGHVDSWRGLSEVLTPCGHRKHYGPIDPTRDVTYERITALIEEIFMLFPDSSIHLGGDECTYYCWSQNRNITSFMEQRNMTDNYPALFSYYIKRLQQDLKKKLKNTGLNSIYWQEVFDEGVKLSQNDIVHIWKGESTMKLAQATAAGYNVLLSSCWYLNYISYGKDWYKYYKCDPQDFPGSREQKERVLGGEACMWGEYVNDLNLLNELWPRASAVAERLWSAQFRSNPFSAEGRFEENRCRMIRRGIPAKAIGGPGPPCTDIPISK